PADQVTYATVAATAKRVFEGSFQSFTGTFVAYDAATGEVLWSNDLPEGTESSAAVAYGMVYVGAVGAHYGTGGHLYAFDQATGMERWHADLSGEVGLESPTVANGVVYMTSQDGTVAAFDAKDGEELWSYNIVRIL